MELSLWPWAVRLAAIVPLLAGGAGAVSGFGFMGDASSAAVDSHGRYLSGLLLGIGLACLWCAGAPRERAMVFGVLVGIVFLGGLARLLGVALAGPPPLPHLLALVMELIVTPALWLWLQRLR